MAQRGISLAQSLLRAQLGQRVNVMILEKALTLDLTQFEDSEFYDKLTRARREASSRPLSLVMRTFALLQNAISLISFGGLLFRFSPWAVLLLVLAGLPAFLAEAKFSGEAFRLFRWRAPESRMQIYLESVLAREDYAKEVKLFELGPRLLDRYRDIFTRLYREDRDLTLRRDAWGFGLGLLGTGGAVRRLRVDRRGNRAGRHDRRPDDHVPHVVPPGPGRGQRGAYPRSAACTRTICTCRICTSTWNSRWAAAAARELQQRARSRRRHPLRGRRVRLSRRRPRRRCPASTCTCDPGESLALVGQNGSGKTTLDQAVDPALRADPRQDLARRPRPEGVGRDRAASAHRRHISGLRALSNAGRREYRRGRCARVRR